MGNRRKKRILATVIPTIIIPHYNPLYTLNWKQRTFANMSFSGLHSSAVPRGKERPFSFLSSFAFNSPPLFSVVQSLE